MPLGIQRFNARHQQPNPRIVFIKPLPGPSEALSQDFLERIAAISSPIMKAHHLSITTLEEHEPNAEFVGRNFNAGEVIQLVLKAPFTGRWLPLRTVQMVMMHELAHCVQMNHSKAFWKVRDGLAGELRGLWGRGYSGDGFWSRGKRVWSAGEEGSGSGAVEGEEVGVRRLCGGTFRSRRTGGKRKRKGTGTGIREGQRLTYAERQQRRIARRFGTNGVALGDDVEARVRLEEGRRPKGKPRVAGSARGRELRAAAALARFGQQKEEDVKKEEEEQESGSETESEYEEVNVKEEAVDLDGSKMLDGDGRALVRVCEDEDKGSVEVQREMEELQELSHEVNPDTLFIKQEDESTASEDESLAKTSRNTASNSKSIRPKPEHSDRPTPHPPSASKALTTTQNTLNPTTTHTHAHIACPICSLTNDPTSPTCSACAHVLDPSQTPNHWRCSSPACTGTFYLNAGDCGICGVCGTKRAVFVGD